MAQRETPKSVTLTELAYLRRLQKYQRRKSEHIEHRLHWLEISCEARNRIVHSAKDLQHELTESIQSGNRPKFSLLYHTFRTLQQACDEWDTQSSVPELANNVSPDHWNGSFLGRVSPDARTSLLAFLSHISFDPIFLLDRLSGLSDSDFAFLSRPYSQTPVGQSIFGSSTRRTLDELEHASVRKLLDFSRSDLLSLLLRLIPEHEQIQGGPFSSAWGVICAGLLSQQKPGSDKFVVTVMHAHFGQLEKTACHSVENWLLETLKDGDFLLYQNEKRPLRTKIQAASNHLGDDPKAVEEFFSKAISKLLIILKDNELTRVIPTSIVNLGKSIVARLDPSSQQQQAAPYFLCTRWLFASYLSALITSPESYGLLLSHHISSTARQRILHELANRARQIMEGVAYTWKRTSPIRPSIVADIESVVDLFRVGPSETDRYLDFDKPGRSVPGIHRKQVTICASEVINAIRTLYPENGGDIFHGLHGAGGSTLKSSASSVSGLSLFRTMSPSEPLSPRNGYRDPVLEVGIATELPSLAPAPMAAYSDPLYETTGPDAFAHGLREAIVELSASIGCTPGCGNLDLFSEKWISLESCVTSGTISWIDCARSNSDCLHDTTNFGDRARTEHSVDPVTFDFIITGIHTLLDGCLPTTNLHHTTIPHDIDSLHTALVSHFEGARASCYHQGDFAKAHLFFRLAKATTSLSAETTECIMQAVAHDFQRSTDMYRLIIQNAGNHIEKLSEDIDFLRTSIKSVSHTNDRLREKMWYVSDIQRASHYEDLRKIVTALRVMATSSRPKVEKRQPLLRHRSASNSLNHNMQMKAEAATLELLSAPIARGGTNKLSDFQVDMTLRWMQSRGVERVCRAEERIHRFCSELTRCLDQFVGQSITENPILWSSELFQDQKPLSGQINGRANTPSSDHCALDQLRSMYRRSAPSIYEAHSSPQWGRVTTPSRSAMYPNFAVRSMSPKSVTHDYFGCRSPTLTHKSSGTLWSTFSAGPQSPSSATSFPSRALSPLSTGRPLSRHSCLQQSQTSFLEELKQNLTSLLLSDFHNLFRSGSETDKAMRKTLKLTMPLRGELSDVMDYDTNVAQHSFDFGQAFRMLLKRFELQASPYAKLDVLLELQDMLKAHRADSGLEYHDSPGPSSNLFYQRRLSLRIDTSSAPRTSSGHDSTILSFRQLFQNHQLRPKTLFRDLQYIASLVPLNVLDNTPRGRAFWNATIAALDLKEGICQGMIETADQIIHHHTFNRGHSRVTSAAQAKRDATAFSPSTPQPSDPSIADLSMSDAATLLQLTAKEGIPAAQRELATLYLTHPELLGICLSPFSKLRDVFKDVEKDREALSERYDPVAMAVAQHWMELSAKGGDGPAVRYLRAKDEFDKIP